MNLRKSLLAVLAGAASALVAATPAVADPDDSFWAGGSDYAYEFILPDFCTRATIKADVQWPDAAHARVSGVAITDRAFPDFGCDPVPPSPDDPAEHLVAFTASFQGMVVDELRVRFVRADLAEGFDFTLPRGPGVLTEIDLLTVQVCGFDRDGAPAGCRADSLRRFTPDHDCADSDIACQQGTSPPTADGYLVVERLPVRLGQLGPRRHSSRDRRRLGGSGRR